MIVDVYDRTLDFEMLFVKLFIEKRWSLVFFECWLSKSKLIICCLGKDMTFR